MANTRRTRSYRSGSRRTSGSGALIDTVRNTLTGITGNRGGNRRRGGGAPPRPRPPPPPGADLLDRIGIVGDRPVHDLLQLAALGTPEPLRLDDRGGIPALLDHHVQH